MLTCVQERRYLPPHFGYFLHAFCRLSSFVKDMFSYFFQKFRKSQTVWIQIRPDGMSGLMWVHAICGGHH